MAPGNRVDPRPAVPAAGLVGGRARLLPGRGDLLQNGQPARQIGVDRRDHQAQRGHPGRRVLGHPVGDPADRTDERGPVDEPTGHCGGRAGPVTCAGQPAHLRRLARPAELTGQPAVEVALRRADAHQMGVVRAKRVHAPVHVLADGGRQAGDHLEPGQAGSTQCPPFGDVPDRLRDLRRRGEHADPAIRNLAGQPEVARPHRTQVDGHAGAGLLGEHVQRRRLGPGRRQPVVLAGVGHRRAGQCAAHDLHVLAGPPQRPLERHAVPAVGDVRIGHSQAQAEAAAGQRVECRRGERGETGRARGDLHHARGQADPVGPARDQAEHAGRVGPVAFGGEDDVEAELLRRRRQFRGTPVDQVHAEFHGGAFPVRPAGARRRRRGRPRRSCTWRGAVQPPSRRHPPGSRPGAGESRPRPWP